MMKRAVFILALYVGSLMLVAVPAAAQAPTAAISLSCAPISINVEVKPGSTYSGFTTCTASNPTTYQEKISILVTSDGLATASPGDMYIGGNQEVDFQISVRATPYLTMQSRTLSVSATVQEINSLPPVNTASSQNNMIVNIMQYSLVQVEAVEPFVQLMPKKDKNFEFKVYNLGNQIDFMKVGVTDSSRDDLEQAGFTINLPAVKVQIDAIPTATNVRVMARTPKTQGWSDAYHVLDFYAESEFACNNGGCIRESQMITIYVRGVYLPGFEVIPALSMLALAAAVVGRRMTGSEDEEGEWREAAPGL
ncbi:MAG: choice-of-anchor T family protein [Candidatus Poseidoniaceae archaeon]|tara:strand:+ start:103 stop:1026 length:924 start_codon:yes stop_codon:yes gene_type:complete